MIRYRQKQARRHFTELAEIGWLPEGWWGTSGEFSDFFGVSDEALRKRLETLQKKGTEGEDFKEDPNRKNGLLYRFASAWPNIKDLIEKDDRSEGG